MLYCAMLADVCFVYVVLYVVYTVGLKKKSVIFVIFRRLTVLNQMMSSSEKVGAVTYIIAFLILLIVEVLL